MSEAPPTPRPPRAPLRGARLVVTVVGVIIGFVALAGIAIAVLLTILLAPRDGADIARQRVDDRARAIEEQLGYWYESLDAATLAAWHFTSPDSDAVRPFAWTGATDAPAGADVDVLIRMTVSPPSSGGIFQARISPGSAEGCFRYHVRNTENVSSRRIDCPPGVGDALPTPAPAAGLPDDAEARLGEALASADAATLADRVRAAFPDEDVTVDTAVTPTGELVAAVGVAVHRDCIVVVRRLDGSAERISFDQAQSEPGEIGCSVELYTRTSA